MRISRSGLFRKAGELSNQNMLEGMGNLYTLLYIHNMHMYVFIYTIIIDITI